MIDSFIQINDVQLSFFVAPSVEVYTRVAKSVERVVT